MVLLCFLKQITGTSRVCSHQPFWSIGSVGTKNNKFSLKRFWFICSYCGHTHAFDLETLSALTVNWGEIYTGEVAVLFPFISLFFLQLSSRCSSEWGWKIFTLLKKTFWVIDGMWTLFETSRNRAEVWSHEHLSFYDEETDTVNNTKANFKKKNHKQELTRPCWQLLLYLFYQYHWRQSCQFLIILTWLYKKLTRTEQNGMCAHTLLCTVRTKHDTRCLNDRCSVWD